MTLEEELFARHAGKRILLDSNLLLVYATGAVGTHLFSRFKRVSAYTFADYDLLVELLSSFTVLVTSPHILTEVSNLANSLSGSYRENWYSNLAILVASEQAKIGVQENWIPAEQLVDLPEFADFGITDCVVSKLALDALVLTDDYRLSGLLRSRGIDALNFSDLRAIQRLIQ